MLHAHAQPHSVPDAQILHALSAPHHHEAMTIQHQDHGNDITPPECEQDPHIKKFHTGEIMTQH